jgi:hypothetical protein
MGKIMFLIGILAGLLVYFWDIIAGKEEIILGARSWAALCAAGILIILGLVFWKKK